MMSQLKESGKQEFPILIKADVQGSDRGHCAGA
jgi:hypothetical protein